jgi:hypothetical protein
VGWEGNENETLRNGRGDVRFAHGESRWMARAVAAAKSEVARSGATFPTQLPIIPAPFWIDGLLSIIPRTNTQNTSFQVGPVSRKA